eukprot:1146324-Pelagomonas_calceolata.AAC.3
MHARIAGPPDDKDEDDAEEQDPPRSMQGRRAKSMVAKRQHSFHVSNVPKAEQAQEEEGDGSPSKSCLGGMRAKSQSFATRHSVSNWAEACVYFRCKRREQWVKCSWSEVDEFGEV